MVLLIAQSPPFRIRIHNFRAQLAYGFAGQRSSQDARPDAPDESLATNAIM